MNRCLLTFAWVAMVALVDLRAESRAPRPRNIVLILADDLGYGDISCYGATRVSTPNVDGLARQGMRFSAAYATSATCTPSRYSLLTGEYAWRRDDTGILAGDDPLIIDPARATLPEILRRAGYVTGAVGKWHLGLGPRDQPIDWNRPVAPGPREVGFDYSFIMAATADRVPCVFLENQRVVGLVASDPLLVSYGAPFPGEPTGISERASLKLDWSHGHNQGVVNGIGRIGYYQGGRAAQWRDEDMADTFTGRAVDFMVREKDHPFFLYFATHDIHVPRVPNPRFVGRTQMGPRGDSIVQFDWEVGQVLATLERLGLADNTLVILTSDNGPVVDDGYRDRAAELLGSHRPGGPYRGGKYSRFEAGTRVPLIVRWSGRVPHGTSEALFSQVDLAASLASLVSQALGPKDAPDSLDSLATLLGQNGGRRAYVIEHHNRLALREGRWKYIEPAPGVAWQKNTNTETANLGRPQLYDVVADPGETRNLANGEPARVSAMARRLEDMRRMGFTRPGAKASP